MFGVDNTLLSLVGGKKFEVLLCALALLLLRNGSASAVDDWYIGKTGE